jgi:hypothetical protein
VRDAAHAVTGAFGGDAAASKTTIGDWMADRDAGTRSAGDRQRRANAQDHADDGRFVPGVLKRAIPASGRLERLHAKAQSQQRCSEHLADGDAHAPDSSMHGPQRSVEICSQPAVSSC